MKLVWGKEATENNGTAATTFSAKTTNQATRKAAEQSPAATLTQAPPGEWITASYCQARWASW